MGCKTLPQLELTVVQKVTESKFGIPKFGIQSRFGVSCLRGSAVPPGEPLWTLELCFSRLRGHLEDPESCQPDVRRSSRSSWQRLHFLTTPTMQAVQEVDCLSLALRSLVPGLVMKMSSKFICSCKNKIGPELHISLEEGTYHKRLFRGPNTNDKK